MVANNDESDAPAIAKDLSTRKYAVAMKLPDASYLVSINSTKETAEEVYALVEKYNKSKSAEDSEEIFNVSEDEIEGTEFETIGEQTYAKGSGHLVINAKNVITVEV